MKKILLVTAFACFLLPTVSISQDNTVEQKLATAGYLLFKTSNSFKLSREDLSALVKKLRGVDELDDKGMCRISLLEENILLIETICMYESILLGAMKYLEDGKKREQYNLHYTLLKDDILKRLYLNYKSFQSNYVNLDDKLFLEVADRAKEEMITALRLIEEVIKVLQRQDPMN